MRKGFTLIELSIVLVIIGLLIGGILVAQSMVSTAKIEATVTQLQQFDAGVENFKTKYGYLPGDAPAFGGNGDGVLAVHLGCMDNETAVFDSELANFWNNLWPDKYADSGGGCGGHQAYTAGPLTNVPLSKIGKTGSFFVVTSRAIGYPGSGYGISSADTTNIENFYVIFDPTHIQAATTGSYWGYGATTASNSALDPISLLALDTKMDDGLADSGNVIAGMFKGCGGVGGGCLSPVPLASCASGSVYGTTSDYVCTPAIRIGAVAGDPQ